MNWLGKISNQIEATMKRNDAMLRDPRQACECGNVINLNEVADREIGIKLGIALNGIEKKLKWTKKWNALHEKARAGGITLDEFYGKQIKLWGQYKKKTKEWGSSEVSFSADAICTKCQTNLGKLSVTLRLVNAPEVMDITKNQLINLEASRQVLAYASKRMRFRSVEQLKAWLNNEDAEKAKAVLEKTIAELNELALPYETSKIIGELSAQIEKISKQIRSRKIEFINAVEKIVKERIVII